MMQDAVNDPASKTLWGLLITAVAGSLTTIALQLIAFWKAAKEHEWQREDSNQKNNSTGEKIDKTTEIAKATLQGTQEIIAKLPPAPGPTVIYQDRTPR